MYPQRQIKVVPLNLPSDCLDTVWLSDLNHLETGMDILCSANMEDFLLIVKFDRVKQVGMLNGISKVFIS